MLVTAAVVGAVALHGALTAAATPALADGDLVIGRSSGSRYLDLDGRLHPVRNIASARLLSRTPPRTVLVDDAVLGSLPHGALLGIDGAPDDLPARDRLTSHGWVACPDGSDVRLRLVAGAAPDRPATRAGTTATADPSAVDPVVATMVVAAPSVRYLLVGDRRYALPPASAGALGAAWGSTTAVAAPAALLDLFDPGTPLDAASLSLGPGRGSALPDALRRSGLDRVGQLVDTGGVAGVVLADGLAPLDPFAAAVYAATAPGTLGRAVPLEASDLGAVPLSGRSDPAPADWPGQLPLVGAGAPCARLDVSASGAARTALTLLPVPGAAAAGRTGGATPRATGTRTPPAAEVTPGWGALVRAGSPGAGGVVLLVDGTGTAFPVPEPTGETLSRLGYGDLPVPSVPLAWAALLPRGSALSVAAATAPPT